MLTEYKKIVSTAYLNKKSVNKTSNRVELKKESDTKIKINKLIDNTVQAVNISCQSV